MPKNHVMLDLETLGTRPGCVILSLGAVAFDEHGLEEEYYSVISLDTSLGAGLVVEPETERWWDDQPAEAASVIDQAADPKAPGLAFVLHDFGIWLAASTHQTTPGFLWGNGSDFDNAILGVAYYRCGYAKPPWASWNNRCYRTIKNLKPDVKIQRKGTHHNALDDAKGQAEHLIKLMGLLGLPLT